MTTVVVILEKVRVRKPVRPAPASLPATRAWGSESRKANTVEPQGKEHAK